MGGWAVSGRPQDIEHDQHGRAFSQPQLGQPHASGGGDQQVPERVHVEFSG